MQRSRILLCVAAPLALAACEPAGKQAGSDTNTAETADSGGADPAGGAPLTLKVADLRVAEAPAAPPGATGCPVTSHDWVAFVQPLKGVRRLAVAGLVDAPNPAWKFDLAEGMLDKSLPLTLVEYLEWGNPNVERYYRYMRSYSPYDNLEPGAYPAMLVETSLHDSQVMYWEPAKYVAKLRRLKTDANPLILKTIMEAGHGGASGRYDALRELAFTYSFILDQVGLAN